MQTLAITVVNPQKGKTSPILSAHEAAEVMGSPYHPLVAVLSQRPSAAAGPGAFLQRQSPGHEGVQCSCLHCSACRGNYSAERYIACRISTAFLLHGPPPPAPICSNTHQTQMCSDIFKSCTDLLGICKENIKHSLLLFWLGLVYSLRAVMLKIQRSKTFKHCPFG